MRRQNRRGEIAIRGHRMVSMRLVLTALLAGCAALPCGCNSLLNGWLDPSVVGSFSRTVVNEIRTSLTLEDTPSGIVGSEYPTRMAPESRSRLTFREASSSVTCLTSPLRTSNAWS